jgi:dUTP pyrophosphatase
MRFNQMKLNAKVVNPLFDELKLELPARGSEQAAGLDLRACIKEPLVLEPGQSKIIGTGLALEPVNGDFEIPIPIVGMAFIRSGLGTKHGLCLSNGTGIIDQDYRGEVMLSVVNHGHRPYTVQPGDRIGQILYLPILVPTITRVEQFKVETARGDGGFGSTGKN